MSATTSTRNKKQIHLFSEKYSDFQFIFHSLDRVREHNDNDCTLIN